MDLSNLRRRIELRSLRFDLLVAYAAVSMGPLVAVFVWAVTPLEGPILLVPTVVGSAGFLLLLLSYGARDKPRALARVIGAEAGWLGFLWVLVTPQTHTPILFTTWIIRFWLPWVLFFVIALVLVCCGLIACDRAWTWISKRVGGRSPVG